MPLDIASIRSQFPILTQRIGGYPLIYLDSAATSQKPRDVLNVMQRFYEHDNGNAHRGMHILAERATVAFEGARETVAEFLNAAHAEEIIFTKHCTESINLVARSWGASSLQTGDAVILSLLEHHSNIVPWLQLKEEKGIELRWIGIDDEGRLLLEQLQEFLKDGRARLVAITGQSNVLGIRPRLREIIGLAHESGAIVLVDAAQRAAHLPIDVQELDCDFLAGSGHKLYGPAGIGILYGKRHLLKEMPPFLGGGMMIHEVREDGFSPADIPQRFEAGTQPVAEAAGLAAAIRWAARFPWQEREAHERALIARAQEKLKHIPGVRTLGPRDPGEISGCISFLSEGIHPHDLTDILGHRGICLRAGHHCAQPLHRRLGVAATSRLSVGIYNTLEEIDAAAAAIADVVRSWRGKS